MKMLMMSLRAVSKIINTGKKYIELTRRERIPFQEYIFQTHQLELLKAGAQIFVLQDYQGRFPSSAFLLQHCAIIEMVVMMSSCIVNNALYPTIANPTYRDNGTPFK